MMLEFREENQLEFDWEYVLNRKPNSVDILIKKPDGITVKSGLGVIFQKINLIEYKNRRDHLGKKIYHRTSAYSDLFIAYEKEDYLRQEMTLTFIREAKPVKMMKYLEEQGFTITEFEQGIYHIRRKWHSDMQIIVTNMVDKKYKWITKLTDRLELEDFESLKESIGELTEEADLINAEAVMDLVTKLNQDKEFIKELTGMGAFRDLFKEEFAKRKICRLQSRELK